MIYYSFVHWTINNCLSSFVWHRKEIGTVGAKNRSRNGIDTIWSEICSSGRGITTKFWNCSFLCQWPEAHSEEAYTKMFIVYTTF